MPVRLRALMCVCSVAMLPLGAAQAHVSVGPPWISVELPANPLDPALRGALLLVRTYHHSTAIPRVMRCAFEGVVDGERRTAPCRVEGTEHTGVYAVRGDVPEQGMWMLVVSGGENREFGTALVSFGQGGEVTSVRVPARRDGRWTVPARVSERELDRILRGRWRALSSETGTTVNPAIALLALLPVGGFLAMRRRRR